MTRPIEPVTKVGVLTPKDVTSSPTPTELVTKVGVLAPKNVTGWRSTRP